MLSERDSMAVLFFALILILNLWVFVRSNSIILINIIINMDIVPRRNCKQDKENVNNRNDLTQGLQSLETSTKMPNLQLHKRNTLAQSFQRITLKQFDKQNNKEESNSRVFVKLYRKELGEQSKRNGSLGPFLDLHYIDAGLRARMVDWMTEVTTSYRFDSKTYFDSVMLLDQYLAKQKKSVAASELHALGVAAMLLSSKSNEIRPLRIHTAYEKIGHRKISINKLSLSQAQIMKVLQYKLNQWTFYDIATFILEPYEQQELLPVLAYLGRIVLIEYEFYRRMQPQVLGEALAWLSMKIIGKPLRVDENARDCGEEIMNLLFNFKDAHPNLRNIARFTERSVVQLVQQFLAAV